LFCLHDQPNFMRFSPACHLYGTPG
jgi:hypothetical protein